MDSELATAIAVYVVESVKKHDAYCGGATKVAILRAPKNSAAEALNPLNSPALQSILPAYPPAGLGSYSYSLPPCKVFSKTKLKNWLEFVAAMDDKPRSNVHKIIQKALLKETRSYLRIYFQ